MSEIDDDAQACMSRSTGLPASLGKATSELKSKVPDSVKDDFVRLARSLGLNESELLRDMVLVRLYGADRVERMHAQRIRMVAGIGPETQEAQS
jgi:hypothetical protein